MLNKFKKIEVEQIEDNTFKLIGADWMLITAGTMESFNTMTANWGGFGVLWFKKVCFCFIRPIRHTYSFIEKSDSFTLSFFEEKYRSVLDLCGSTSGKKVDKIAKTGITPVKGKLGVYFSEARLVIECKKIYCQDINPNGFLDPEIYKNYPNKDYHRMYIGEVKNCLMK
ncbi:MAG: flavin reductase [Elusimicrobia bacterium]|nr:flavin reductase [Elusimicrobiota bacterium]